MLRACLKLLFGAAFFSSAWATSHYPDEAHATRRTVIVRVEWMADQAEADRVCSKLAGEQPTGKILACYMPSNGTIYAVQPKSFNDLYGLMILGHEFWHALGAEHPEEKAAN